MLLTTRKPEQVIFATGGRKFNAISLHYRLKNARRMDATFLSTISVKATGNEVMVKLIQLHVIVSAIIPTI
jgi:hypothetical protein